MSFSNALIAQQERFHAMAANLQRVTTSPHLVIDDQFQVTDKRGWKWRLLCLLSPFYCLVGRDVYSHYRIDRVAAAILNLSATNKLFLNTNSQLKETVEQGIRALAAKTEAKKSKSAPKVGAILASFLELIRDQALPRRTDVSSLHLAPPALSAGAAAPPSTPQRGEGASERPMSASRIRSPDSVAPRASSGTFQLIWPSDEELAACGVSPDQTANLQRILDQFVAQCFSSPGHKLHFVKEEGKRILQLVDAKGEVTESAEIPISLEVVYQDGQLQDILLITKLIIGKGAETNVRLCFSLSQGIQLVRKNCFGRLQRQLLEYFRDAQPPGIIPIYNIRESQGPEGRKVQSLEHFWLGNLREFITNQPMPTFEDRLRLAMDILRGAQAIHRVTCDKYTLSDQTAISPFRMFHLDISPSNILLNQDEETTDPETGSPIAGRPKDAVLTDFGCANPENVGGTPGFKSPQLIHLCRNYQRMGRRQIIDYNIRYGQSSDVWSIGLVFVALLTWQVDPLGGPPLPCIEDSLKKSRVSGDSVATDSNIALLRQNEIDEDLIRLKQKCIIQEQSVKRKVAMTNLWDGVIAPMVRIEPEERITIPGAIDRLGAIRL